MSTTADDPLARYALRIGDLVTVIGWPTPPLEVIDDPALVTLRLPNGLTLKAGRLAVARV